MTAKTGMVDDYAFAAEGMAATACSAALTRVRSLAQLAPQGRAFAAIATLTEFSGRAEAALAAGAQAMSEFDDAVAIQELDVAMGVMDRMAAAALPMAGSRRRRADSAA